jgi:predicted permease
MHHQRIFTVARLYPRRLQNRAAEIQDFWRLTLADAGRERGIVGVVSAIGWLLSDICRAWMRAWAEDRRRLRQLRQQESQGDSWMLTWLSDVRYSFRSLLRRPGMTMTSVLSLAVGLGGSLAIFASAYAVLFRPLPFPDPSRVVSVQAMVQRDTLERRAFSVPDFFDYQAATTTIFSDLAAWDTLTLTLQIDGAGVPTSGEMVMANYLSLLGAQPIVGSSLPDRQMADASPAMVLSERVWQTHFNRDPAVVGRTVTGDDQSFTIVGVMPASFQGVTGDADWWVPFAQHPALVGDSLWNNRGSRWHAAVGRLEPGVSVEAANTALSTVAGGLATAFPPSNTGYTAQAELLSDALFGDVRPQLVILLTAVGVVLFMTCVNVANLLVARLSARQYEFAVRSSLGATRGRIVSLAAADGITLAVLGALAGTPLAAWLVAVLRRLDPAGLPTFAAPTLSGPVITVGIGLTLLAALFITVASVLSVRAGRTGLVSTRGASESAHTIRLRKGLTTIQVACAVALLTTVVLLGMSFRNLTSIETGFRTSGTLAVRVDLPPTRFEPPRRLLVAQELRDRVAAIPGVQSASVSSDVPLGGGSSASFYAVDVVADNNADKEGRIYIHQVSETFFETAGMRIIDGTTVPAFTGQPASLAQPDLPVVVSERTAQRFWPGTSAVGQRLKLGRSDTERPWMRIVGVVGETTFRGLPDNPTLDPDLYLPYAVRPISSFWLLLHTDVDPASVTSSVQRAVSNIDPLLPLAASFDIAERVADATAPQRFLSQLSAAFGLVALLLAVVGTYGVVAYQVVLSQRAIGIRLALGAVPRQILTGILGGTAQLLLVGLVIGAAAAIWAAQRVADQLFEVTGANVPVIIAAAVIVSVVGLAASWLPARRAMRVDPVTVLRAD